MLLLLEITGGRRSELARIRVDSVLAAMKMAQPMLLIPSSKASDEEGRVVPISSHDLRVLHDFIEFSRGPALRKNGAKDNGMLFVSSRTGAALNIKTMTNEVQALAAVAGLDAEASPHLFRHRFITKVIVMLIEQHNVRNTDQFRRLLLDSEAIKRKVAEWTGHKNLASLEVYIHLAFEEVAGFRRTLDLVGGAMVLETTVSQIESQLQIMEDGGSSARSAERIRAILEEAARDIRRLLEEPGNALEVV